MRRVLLAPARLAHLGPLAAGAAIPAVVLESRAAQPRNPRDRRLGLVLPLGFAGWRDLLSRKLAPAVVDRAVSGSGRGRSTPTSLPTA